ncbi:MAG: hypothetical protein Q8Q12_00570 [bacterium]|nr:hypothetical protein [bacterium]
MKSTNPDLPKTAVIDGIECEYAQCPICGHLMRAVALSFFTDKGIPSDKTGEPLKVWEERERGKLTGHD